MQGLLRLRLKFPYVPLVVQQFADTKRDVNPNIASFAAGLENQDAVPAALRQPGRQSRTGRSGTNNHVVKNRRGHFVALSLCLKESRRKL